MISNLYEFIIDLFENKNDSNIEFSCFSSDIFSIEKGFKNIENNKEYNDIFIEFCKEVFIAKIKGKKENNSENTNKKRKISTVEQEFINNISIDNPNSIRWLNLLYLVIQKDIPFEFTFQISNHLFKLLFKE
jgi:hypothetical protein